MMRGDGRSLNAVCSALLSLAIALTGILVFGQYEPTGAQQATSELPTEPILRIEAGQHVAISWRIDTDAANRFVVTASEDKTVRVWSLPDGRLQRVLRLPIDYGNIGKAFSVGISPDGATIAVGGWTSAGPKYNIFLFDRASGALKQQLSDLPGAINHLAYSPDSRRLTASLSGNGIRVYDAVNGYRLLPSDANYGGLSSSAHFDRAGRLVTTSLDGFIRLYEADQYQTPAYRFEWKGHRPHSAAFSPDGRRVAAGDQDSPAVVILSGANLTQPFNPDMTGIPSGSSLHSVAWSQDGRFLYAGGDWWVRNLFQVRRWSDGGRGRYINIASAPHVIQDLIGLRSGSMLYLGRDWGLISTDAKATRLQPFGALRFGIGDGHSLRVSSDGSVVEFESWEPQHTYRFALADRLVKIDPPADDALKAPVTEAAGLKITSWNTSKTPAVNGTPIKLDQEERSLDVAIVPGAQQFVLAGDFWLRLLDEHGQNVWPQALTTPDVAWHVNVTADKRLVVGAYGDGTIRWHRLSDGKELLALFIHPDGQRWIVWTPQGYYDASVGADELIGWHINHGYDRAPDFYPASQFRDRFYRPDVIQRVLQTPNLDVEEALRDADRAANRPSTRAPPVSSLLTPVVQINDPISPAAADRTDFQLGYSVRLPAPDDSLRLEALVDGVKVVADDRPLVTSGAIRAGNLHLTLPRRDSKVSVLAYNENGTGEPATVQVKWRGPGTDPKLTLYVLAIGISDYKDKNFKLKFAAKDAGDFVAWAKRQEGGLYEKVITYSPPGISQDSIRDSSATRDAILDGLDWITRAVTNSNDVAMIFLAGHGIKSSDQHYRFLPYDYDDSRPLRTTIADAELEQYLTKIGGKKIFFFDTCYSGNVLNVRAPNTLPDVDKFANELRAAENGIVVFTSSTGNELSQELDAYMNGAFTLALVEGLRGAAARPQIPVIMVSDLEGYVSKRVRELTNGNQKPMVGMPKTVEDYPISMRLQ
jgi:WD40 repeat protein